MSSIFAKQDQAIVTRQHERDVLKRVTDGKYQLCLVKDEAAQHMSQDVKSQLALNISNDTTTNNIYFGAFANIASRLAVVARTSHTSIS